MLTAVVKSILVMLCCFFTLSTLAQQLVANPSFEDVNICTEYNAPCAPCAWIAVTPDAGKIGYLCNGKSFQGQHHVALLQEGSENPDARAYMQTQLLCPLQKGMTYRIRLYASTSNYALKAGIRFDTAFTFSETPGCLNMPASVELTEKDQLKKLWRPNYTWYILEKNYVAEQSSTHMIIGNFNAPKRKAGTGAKSNAQLFIDSISVTPVGSTVACSGTDSIHKTLYTQHLRHTIPATSGIPVKMMVHTLNSETSNCDTVILKDDLFLQDRKTLNTRYQQQIDEVLKTYRSTRNARILLIGHAWQTASDEYNKIISYDKAKAVATYLVYNEGYSFEDFDITGMGKQHPRYDTSLNNGADNNRVEMVLCRPAVTVNKARAVPKPDTLVIPDILFRFNSSELNTDLYSALDSLMLKIPRNSSIELKVTGHTDNAGREEYNQVLSLKRATTVARYMEEHGLGDDIRQVNGEGEMQPIAGNETVEGRRKNRRVEIVIFYNK